jgi:hypothetical protein
MERSLRVARSTARMLPAVPARRAATIAARAQRKLA